MTKAQFITDGENEKTAVILPINDYDETYHSTINQQPYRL